MLSLANATSVGPKVLPVVLAVGGATVAGGYARSQRNYSRYNTAQSEPVRAKPFESVAPENRSKYFTLVLESIFA